MAVLALLASTFVVAGGVLVGTSLSAFAAASITVSPDTGLTNGQTVTIMGSGFSKSSIGNVLECNGDASQPTAALPSPVSQSVPVSCTPISLSKLVVTSSTGAVSTTFAVVQGTTGPPCGTSTSATKCPAKDSAGNSPSSDAAKYPCPPTPAQQAAGVTCTLSYGDEAGDTATATILFAGETAPTSTTTSSASSSTTSTAPASTTTVTPSSTTTAPTTTTTPSSTTTTTPSTTTTTTPTTTTTTTPTTTTTTSGPGTGVTASYELFCPGTPVGNVVLNGAVTTGSLSPASPGSGQTFSLSGYQTTVNLPQSLAQAAAALGSTLTGSASAKVDASGATPAATPVGPFDFNVPIPSPVPASGITLKLPSAPETVGPFTATGSTVTVTEDPSASITIEVGGTPLTLTCSAYPDDTITPSGITTSTPSVASIAPVIATSSTTTTTTTTPTSTTTTSPGSTTTTTSTGSPVTITAVLSGAGQTGGTIVVPSGTAVTERATLSGANVSSAGGTVSYTVYGLTFPFFHGFGLFSDSSWNNWWWVPVASGGQVTVTGGTVPTSNPVTLPTGVFFWQATYSGDARNAPSSSTTGIATEIVEPPTTCPVGLGWLSVRCFAGPGPSTTSTATGPSPRDYRGGTGYDGYRNGGSGGNDRRPDGGWR
ncbi:MAG TPA: hypothetical protein VMB72_08910 [Acidimicrobiales bacterium]|nr:hypothetical protein [Acidimicrobiales bacterium]